MSLKYVMYMEYGFWFNSKQCHFFAMTWCSGENNPGLKSKTSWSYVIEKCNVLNKSIKYFSFSWQYKWFVSSNLFSLCTPTNLRVNLPFYICSVYVFASDGKLHIEYFQIPIQCCEYVLCLVKPYFWSTPSYFFVGSLVISFQRFRFGDYLFLQSKFNIFISAFWNV